jgi:probable blue pigment (indigoidine) exporter
MFRFMRTHKSALSLTAAAASWGTATVISKRAVDEIQPLTLLPIELVISVAVLGLAGAMSRQKLRWSSELTKLGWLGVLNPGISYALSLAGLARITASTSVLLWAIEPVLILGLAFWVLRDRVSTPLAACAASALAGVVLVVFQPGAQASTAGILLTVAGVAACATYTVLSSKFLAEASSLSVVLVQQASALAFALILFVGSIIVGSAHSVSSVSAGAWVSAVAAGFLYYAVAFWFFVTGLRGVKASFAGMFINLIPIFGLTASYLFLDERLSARQWVGAVVIIGAVVAITRLQTRQVESPPPQSAVPSRGDERV